MTTLKQWFQQPDPPVIQRDAYVPALMPSCTGQDVSTLMPAAGQNAVPPPQKLYDLGSFSTPFRVLWRRARNTLTG